LLVTSGGINVNLGPSEIVLIVAHIKAWVACEGAGAAYGKVFAACEKAGAACEKAGAACDEASAACGEVHQPAERRVLPAERGDLDGCCL
jgi:hypothetical protein